MTEKTIFAVKLFPKKRKEIGLSQRRFAEKMQIAGLDIDKNAVQRIECGKHFVTDIELKHFALFFRYTADELLGFKK